jgi:hypothetical protein
MSVGKQVRLYLADGTPGGLLTAEIMNWTGHIVAAPRSQLRVLLKRQEIQRTGIYILIDDDSKRSEKQLAYIGEGDDVGTRLYHHSRSEDQGGKDFWEKAIVLTSKDANLTKAHARYLESRFITLAHQANRAKVVNATAPPLLPLPEADISDMEFFITQVKIILPVLGVNILRSVSTTLPPEPTEVDIFTNTQSSPTFELRRKRDDLVATAREVDGEFTVLGGSQVRMAWTGGDHGYKQLRKELERDGTIVPSVDGKSMRFMHDQVFASPSAAAAIVVGSSANGRNEWKVQRTGASYGNWQNEGVDRAAAEASS